MAECCTLIAESLFMSEPDYIVDLGGGRANGSPAGQGAQPGKSAAQGRPFISVHFACCNVYNRVYLNPAGTAYVGWCPRCARKVTAVIGPEGTDARSFQAG